MTFRKILWGLLTVGCGVLLVLAAIGYNMEYDWVRIFGSVVLLGVAITSLAKLRFILVTIPLALVAYLWRTPLGFPNMNMWLLLAASAVLGIGLSIIFHRRNSHFHINTGNSREKSISEETLSDKEFINIDASFGEYTKYVHADDLKKVNISSNFSSVKAYFDQCQISSDGLIIHVSGNFSGIVLTIPKAWMVENHISTFAASVNHVDDSGAAKTGKVILKGSLNFAEVKIIHV